MKTTIQEPREILGYLKPYYKAQKVIVIVEFFGGEITTGELQSIGDESIEISSEGGLRTVTIEISKIKELTHSPVYEGKLSETAA